MERLTFRVSGRAIDESDSDLFRVKRFMVVDAWIQISTPRLPEGG